MSTLPDQIPPDSEEIAPQHSIPSLGLDRNAPEYPESVELPQSAGNPNAASGHEFSRAETDHEIDVALAHDATDKGDAKGMGISPYIEPVQEGGALASEETPAPALLFQSHFDIEPALPHPPHIPHFGHVILLLIIALLSLLCAGGIGQIGIHYHLFGVKNTQDAITDIHYTLGSEAILYIVTLVISILIFPLLWHKRFFAGVSWNAATARRLSSLLIGAAFLCFLLALLNEWLMPGPPDAPIDKMFRIPGAAWLLFGFGVTFAPFFEELVFRGFLLPSLCTACDWSAAFLAAARDRGTVDFTTFASASRGLRPLAADGTPRWSFPAMLIASILTSLPFAGMHAAQTGYSWGPLVLLMCVSLVLCWVRLGARSLASSVLVHASYNFMLFALMLLGTGGFRHLDNM